jgi:lysophospholipase L1-like esterase
MDSLKKSLNTGIRICLFLGATLLFAQETNGLQVTQRLSQAGEPVRIVCFGDSITGAYYHSGGRRAWPEMLKVALTRLYPEAGVEVVNAGISGNTSTQGLARMQKDVLDYKPQLVVIMFGMNDLAYGTVTQEQDAVKKAAFTANLQAMINKCRQIGTEVMLCTQNPVYPEALPSRPPERVGEFAAIIRQLGTANSIPVADVYTDWFALRASDLRSWRLLMSETIHPSMAGHKRMAELVSETIAGRSVSLSGELPEQPVCGTLIARLKAKQPVSLVVPFPLVNAARTMVLRRFPDAELTIIPLSENAATLDAVVTEHQGIRARNPHLVLVSLGADLLPVDTDDHYIRQASWMVNWALPFSGTAWAVAGVDPVLLSAELTQSQQGGAELLEDIVRAHDLEWSEGEKNIQLALDSWFDRQLSSGEK